LKVTKAKKKNGKSVRREWMKADLKKIIHGQNAWSQNIEGNLANDWRALKVSPTFQCKWSPDQPNYF
jgi:hypothetical protein